MTAFSSNFRRLSLSLIVFFGLGLSTVFASAEAETEPEEFNASEVILHHVMDDHVWHFWDGHHGTIFLPVIVYSEKGLDVFSSHHFYDEHHEPTLSYNGYKLEHNHIILEGS